MPVDFIGTDTWRETITGPSNADPATGLSVSDMGVLLADRSLYLYNRRLSAILVETDPTLSEDSVTATFAQSALEIAIELDVESSIIAIATVHVATDANGAKVRLSLWDDGPAEYAVGLQTNIKDETVTDVPATAIAVFNAVPAGNYTLHIDFAELGGGGAMTLLGPATLACLIGGV